MNSLGQLYVAAHINELLNLTAAERLAPRRPPRRSRIRAIASIGRRGWSLVTGPAERPLQLPTLVDYPFRG